MKEVKYINSANKAWNQLKRGSQSKGTPILGFQKTLIARNSHG